MIENRYLERNKKLMDEEQRSKGMSKEYLKRLLRSD